MAKYVIGIDFGTLSGRCVLIDVNSGVECAESVLEYPHGVMSFRLPDGTPLPPDYALQHPSDYLDVLRFTIADVLDSAQITARDVVGIGIDFTASTVLPVDEHMCPLCMKDGFREDKHSYVKLWKHHSAQMYADEITELARQRGEEWLDIYGGVVSCEWLLPKLLQIARESPRVYAATHRFLEAADWLSYEMTGVETRSAVFAGYKCLWNAETGYPSNDFMAALDPALDGVVGTKILEEVLAMDKIAGHISENGSLITGLEIGTPVALPMIDAHASMAALNITHDGDFIAVAGTSLGQMVNSTEVIKIPGICGYIKDGVIPGLYTYEAGQAAVGDMLAWFVNNCIPEPYFAAAERLGVNLHTLLEEKASQLAPGQSGLVALDWWNGNRSVLVNYELTGLIVGLKLSTRPEEIYRALIESAAYGLRRIVEQYEKYGIKVNDICIAGGIARKNAMMMQIYADVLNKRVRASQNAQTGALGSALYAAVAAGAYRDIAEAAQALSANDFIDYEPSAECVEIYDKLYSEYLALHDYFGEDNGMMVRLGKISKAASVK